MRSHARLIHEVENDSADEINLDPVEANTAEKSIEFVYRCSFCGIIENTDELLRKHEELHNNTLKCTVCGIILKHKGNLVLHMRIHVSSIIIISYINKYFEKKSLIWIFFSFRRIKNSSNVINVRRLSFISHHCECIYKPHILMLEIKNVHSVH